LKRRTAIKHIGLGLSAGFAVPWLNACADKEIGPEIKYNGVVGIVGAGAAGLFAADILRSKGIQVKIFEASNRIGGRIQSAKIFDGYPLSSDFPIELGADRIIGKDSKWGQLISLMKVPTVNVSTLASESYILDAQFKTAEDVASDNDFMALENFRSNGIKLYTGTEHVQNAAGVSARVNGILNSMLGNEFGSASNRISAKALGEMLTLQTHDRTNHTLSINPMHDVLVSRFSKVTSKVILNHPIKTIHYADELIQLTDENNQVEEVNLLIITVPVSILKSGAINFSPPLPGSKVSAINKIGMDHSIRMILEFKRNFWGDDVSFIYGGTTCPSYFTSGVGRSDFNKTLSLTINGPSAEQLSGLSDEQKVLTVLSELDSIFDGKATENIKRHTETNEMLYVVKDWSLEPYIKGGYSYPKIGGDQQDRVELATSVDSKLFFAGEATDVVGDVGTVNGALNSGERAALEVIDVIVQAAS
jgi:monoamine oxidase